MNVDLLKFKGSTNEDASTTFDTIDIMIIQKEEELGKINQLRIAALERVIAEKNETIHELQSNLKRYLKVYYRLEKENIELNKTILSLNNQLQANCLLQSKVLC